MTFGQFIKHNILRDKESYVAYWLSSMFTIVIFFVFGANRCHPELKKIKDISDFMLYTQLLVLIFAVGFLTISIHAFIQKKQNSYGMLRMIGMKRRQVAGMIVGENMLTGISALAAGLLVGIVFGHLSVMLMAKMIYLADIPYVFPFEAVRDTICCFLAVFFLVSYLQARSMAKKPIQELLSVKSNESKGMSFHPSLAILGLFLLAYGYTLTFFHQLPFLEQMLRSNCILEKSLEPMILGSVCVGLYLVFREFVFLILSGVRHFSRYYLKNGNAIWITGLQDKLKSAVGTIFISTLLLTAAFSAIISCVSVLAGARQRNESNNPIPIQYLSFEGNQDREVRDVKIIEDKLKKYGVKAQSYRYMILEYGDREMTANKLISQTDYRRESGKTIDLQEGQAIDISGGKEMQASAKVTDTEILTLVGKDSPILDSSRRNHSYVVSDADYQRFLQSKKMKEVTVYDTIVDDKGQRKEVRQAVKEMRNETGLGGYGTNFVFNPRIESLDIQEYTYQMETYISVLLSVIFMLASASLQYFRLLNQARENLPVERNLYRFGLSVRQILGIQRKQMLVIFLLPIGFGVLSTFFAMNYLANMQVSSADLLFRRTVMILIPLIMLELAYFFILEKRLEKKMRKYLSVELKKVR